MLLASAQLSSDQCCCRCSRQRRGGRGEWGQAAEVAVVEAEADAATVTALELEIERGGSYCPRKEGSEGGREGCKGERQEER